MNAFRTILALLLLTVGKINAQSSDNKLIQKDWNELIKLNLSIKEMASILNIFTCQCKNCPSSFAQKTAIEHRRKSGKTKYRFKRLRLRLLYGCQPIKFRHLFP